MLNASGPSTIVTRRFKVLRAFRIYAARRFARVGSPDMRAWLLLDAAGEGRYKTTHHRIEFTFADSCLRCYLPAALPGPVSIECLG
jgi:hypothetical protein